MAVRCRPQTRPRACKALLRIVHRRRPTCARVATQSPTSSGLLRSAKIAGAVRLPLARSWPWGLPSCSADCVKSRMSSTTWRQSGRGGRAVRGERSGPAGGGPEAACGRGPYPSQHRQLTRTHALARLHPHTHTHTRSRTAGARAHLECQPQVLAVVIHRLLDFLRHAAEHGAAAAAGGDE